MKVLTKEHILYVLGKCHINAPKCINCPAEQELSSSYRYLVIYTSNPCETYELYFHMIFWKLIYTLSCLFKTIVII